MTESPQPFNFEMPLWKKILSYPLFLLGAASVLLVLAVFEIVQRACFAAGPRCHERSVFWLNRCLWLCLKIVGAKLEVTRAGPLPSPGQTIIVSNHQSMFDITLIYLLLDEYRPKFISKIELARGIPSVSFNLRRGGNVLIDRSKKGETVEHLRLSINRLKADGASFVIFPEGIRSKTGELQEFKTRGLGVLFGELQGAPVIPVTIDNSWIFTAKKRGPVPLGLTLKVVLGPAVETRGKAEAELIGEIRAVIQNNLDTLRSNSGVSAKTRS